MDEPQNSVDAGGVSAHISVDFENFTLTSITAYEENEQDLSEDSDAQPNHAFHFWIESEQDQFSQELRLASNDPSRDLRWILGAYAFWEDKTGTTGPTFATPMGTMLVRSQANFDNTSYSAYADLEYDINEKWTVKGGLRLGEDNIQGNSIAIFAFESLLGGLDVTTPSFTGEMLPEFDDLLAAAEANGAAVLRVGGPTDPDAASTIRPSMSGVANSALITGPMTMCLFTAAGPAATKRGCSPIRRWRSCWARETHPICRRLSKPWNLG